MLVFPLICSLLSSLTFASAASTVCVLDENLGNITRRKFITLMSEKTEHLMFSAQSKPVGMDGFQEVVQETANRAVKFGDLASFKWLEEKFKPSYFQKYAEKLIGGAMEGNQDDMLIYLIAEYGIQPFDLLLSACASGTPKYISKDSGSISADVVELAAFTCFFSGRPGAIYQLVENFKTRFPELPNLAFDYAVARGFPDIADELLERYEIKPDPAAVALAFYKRNEDVLRFLLRRGLLLSPYRILPKFINEKYRVKSEVRERFDDKYDEKLVPATFITGLRGYQKYLDALASQSFLKLIPIGKGATLGELGMIHLAEMSLAGTTDSLLLLFLPLILNLRLSSAQRLARSMNKKGATKESVIQSISKEVQENKEVLGHDEAHPEKMSEF